MTNGIAVGNTCWDHNCTWTPGVGGTGAVGGGRWALGALSPTDGLSTRATTR